MDKCIGLPSNFTTENTESTEKIKRGKLSVLRALCGEKTASPLF